MRRGIVAGSVLYAIVFAAMLIVRPGTRQFYDAFFNTYQIAAPLFAGVCAFLYARNGIHGDRIRRAGWVLVGLGALSYALGQGTWTYHESVRGIQVPFPGWADAGYLGAYPFLMAGVVLLIGTTHVAGRARVVLDCAIAAGSIGLISWNYVVQPLWTGSEDDLVTKYVAVAYPLCDIASLFAAMVLLSSASAANRQRTSFGLLALGMLGIAFFDTTFTYYTLSGSYHTGMWSDWTCSFGWISVGYASLLPLWREAEGSLPLHSTSAVPGDPTASLSIARMVLPYGAVTVAFAFTAVPSLVRHGYVSNSLFVAGAGLMLLVIGRQIFTLVENQNLTAQLRRFNESLEGVVAERTRQLNALHELTKSVSSSLNLEHVLSEAANYTDKAIPGEGFAIWLFDRETSDEFGLLRLLHHHGLDETVLSSLTDPAAFTTVGIADVAEGDDAASEPDGKLLHAPLLWQQRLIGMIGVLRRNGDFNTAEISLLESIGIEVGTAIENALQYHTAIDAADHDPLTGLFNHQAIHQCLQERMRQAESSEEPFSVIMMDIENFKLFNDTYGHPAGDEILKRVAHVLIDEVGEYDVTARYGGDEFLALLPASDTEEAIEVARRLSARMVEEGFRRGGEERTVPISMSFGIATFPVDGINRHELLSTADDNLYRAKISEESIVCSSQEQRFNRKLRQHGSFGVLDAMVTAVDNKDRYTRQHSEDVTKYALWIAEELGLPDETLRILRTAGLLHDVGKIGVPDEILRKPGRLTDEEYTAMKRHAELGALIVAGVPGMETIVDGVRSHHERWDGRGYPDGLGEEAIPLQGRILAVADAFSAMTTDRPYRRGMDFPTALREIETHMGTQFDPVMAQAFLRAALTRHVALPSERQVERLPEAA